MLATQRLVVGSLAILLGALLIGAALSPAASLPKNGAAANDPFRHGKWPFFPPVRPAVPEVKDSAWVRNSIDSFILHSLEAKGLAPNVEAEKLTLLRRVTLDLTGLPPTSNEQAAFLADQSPQAYEKVVGS